MFDLGGDKLIEDELWAAAEIITVLRFITKVPRMTYMNQRLKARLLCAIKICIVLQWEALEHGLAQYISKLLADRHQMKSCLASLSRKLLRH